MIAGVSTACFYPDMTENALAILAEGRVAATEVFLNSESELAPAYLRGLRRVADAAGMRILSVHPYTSGMEPLLFFSAYRRRFEDGRGFYRKYYQAANILGADIVVFHGNVPQFHMEVAEYAERFGCLLEDARKDGVMLCHENVSRCEGCCPEFFQALSRHLPQAKYVFDVKQAVRAGQDVFAFAEAIAGRIAHVHISDHKEGKDCLSIGEGVFHIQKFLSCLRSHGFDGGVIVELYRENYRDPVELFGGYQQLLRHLSTIT